MRSLMKAGASRNAGRRTENSQGGLWIGAVYIENVITPQDDGLCADARIMFWSKKLVSCFDVATLTRLSTFEAKRPEFPWN